MKPLDFGSFITSESKRKYFSVEPSEHARRDRIRERGAEDVRRAVQRSSRSRSGSRRRSRRRSSRASPTSNRTRRCRSSDASSDWPIAVAALEHELAVERQAGGIERDRSRAGGAAAHRFADRDLARSEHVDERSRRRRERCRAVAITTKAEAARSAHGTKCWLGSHAGARFRTAASTAAACHCTVIRHEGHHRCPGTSDSAARRGRRAVQTDRRLG